MSIKLWPPPTLSGASGSIPRDISAGLTLAAIALPGSMAAAQLTGVSPALGLLAFIIGAVVFALVGGHRTLSVGPDSTIAPMLAAGVAGLGATAAPATAASGQATIMLLSFMVAMVLLIVGIFRGGWITQFLSRPVAVGLLAGIGISIIVSQLGVIFGLEGRTAGAVHAQLFQLWEQRAEINPWSVGVAFIVIITTLVVGRISVRIPGALLGLVLAATAASVWGGGERDVDKLHSPGPVWAAPDYGGIPWGSAWELLPSVLVIAMLITVQTGATEATARQGHQTLDRDLAAIGTASLVAAVAGAFALNASPPRTRLVQNLGGKTQVAALSAAVVVLLLLVFGARLLPFLPAAALAAVLVGIAASLVRVEEMRRIARYSKLELLITLGTLILVCELGVVEGVAIAALVTLLDRTRREARPQITLKGLIPGSNHWVPVNVGVETVQVPGILVWSVEAAIWYADADYVIDELRTEIDDGDYSVVVLDGTAISDLDYTGILALNTLIDHLTDEGIRVLMARPTRPAQKSLRRVGLTGNMHLYPTVSDSVKAGAELAGLEMEFRAARGKKKDLATLAQEGMERQELIDAPPPRIPGPATGPRELE